MEYLRDHACVGLVRIEIVQFVPVDASGPRNRDIHGWWAIGDAAWLSGFRRQRNKAIELTCPLPKTAIPFPLVYFRVDLRDDEDEDRPRRIDFRPGQCR